MSRCVPALVFLIVSFAPPLLADDGELDPSFWGAGVMSVTATADTSFGGLATDPDGRMAIAYSYVPPVGAVEVGVWRSIGDATTGGACDVEPYPGYQRDTRVYDAAFDSFGRLLVLASESYSDGMMDWEAWLVLAYEFPDCVLDTSFSGDGIVTLSGFDLPGLESYARLRPLADGDTIVTGSALSGGPNGCRVHVITLEPNGSWGQTFCAEPDEFPFQVWGVDSVVAANGHVVSVARGEDFGVVDFAPGGAVAGVLAVPFDLGGGDDDSAAAAAATPDGRIVMVGTAELSDGQLAQLAAFAVVRWNAQGVLELDPTFDGDGKLALAIENLEYSYLEDVVVQGDGKIVAGGSAWDGVAGYDKAMAVVRLTPEGTFDSDFNPDLNGVQLVNFNVGSPFSDFAYRVALQNGRVVIAGTVDTAGGIQSVGVARLLNSYVFADGFEAPQAPGWLWVE